MNYEKASAPVSEALNQAGVIGIVGAVRPQVDFGRMAVNEGLAAENARLRAENKRMRAAIDQMSATLAILKASET